MAQPRVSTTRQKRKLVGVGWGPSKPDPAAPGLEHNERLGDACGDDDRALKIHLAFAETVLAHKRPISFTMSQNEVLQCMVKLESA